MSRRFLWWTGLIVVVSGCGGATVSNAAQPDSSPDAFEQVTLRGTGTETEPTTQEVRLPEGDYKLWVHADEPFQPGYDFCGVTAALYDDSGEPVAEIGERPQSATIVSDEATEVAAGTYEIVAYIGCPWVLNLTEE